MEDTLISFQTAILAKEKGFDIPQEKGYYTHGNTQLVLWVDSENHNNQKDFLAFAPTQALLQTYLREKHDILVYVYPKSHHYFEYHIITVNDHIISSERSSNWEEILELGLKEALKLIKTEDN